MHTFVALKIRLHGKYNDKQLFIRGVDTFVMVKPLLGVRDSVPPTNKML